MTSALTDRRRPSRLTPVWAAGCFGKGVASATSTPAKDLIDSGYRRALQQSGQVQRDLRAGQDRARAEAQQYTQQYSQQPTPPQGQPLGARPYSAGAATEDIEPGTESFPGSPPR